MRFTRFLLPIVIPAAADSNREVHSADFVRHPTANSADFVRHPTGNTDRDISSPKCK
jgi:hypothetical protein